MLVTHNIFKSCKNAYTSLQIVLFNFSCKSNYGKKKKNSIFTKTRRVFILILPTNLIIQCSNLAKLVSLGTIEIIINFIGVFFNFFDLVFVFGFFIPSF